MRTKIILDGRFEVTDTGEVYKFKNGVKTPATICISIIRGRKYGQFSYYEDHKQKHIYHHKAIAEAFAANPNNYPLVRFKDGNSLNVCADNLEWCTQKQRTSRDISEGRMFAHRKCACGARTLVRDSICGDCKRVEAQKRRQEISKQSKILSIRRELGGINESLLTPRQLEVIEKRLTGLTYQQIGDELGVTRQCVHDSIKNALIRSNVVSVSGTVA